MGIRQHLKTHHRDVYFRGCAKIHYHVHEPPAYEEEVANEPVTTEGIARYLAELVAEQDLV